MAPLELSRTVNDALQRADFAAALALLESQPNLRVSDLPKLEKKSLTALSHALQTPIHAQFWAQALINTTPSVALFAFRTLVRLGDSIQPMGEPLQKALRDFWENQPPRKEGVWEKAEADQHAAQEAMLRRGFEMLLYADIKHALELCCEQVRIYEPRETARKKLHKERYERAEAARRLVQEALYEHLPDSLKEGKPALYEMRQLVNYEAYKQAVTRPDVIELMSPYGTLEPEPQHNPLRVMQSTFWQQKPARKEEFALARARAGAYFRPYLDAGLQKDGEESAIIALAFIHYLDFFDASHRIEELSAVLKAARPLVVTLPAEHPTRLLWIQVSYSFHSVTYGYTAKVCSDCDLQNVLDTLKLLQLAPDATDFNPEFQQSIENAKSAYGTALHQQSSVPEPQQAIVPEPEQTVTPKQEMVKHQVPSRSTPVEREVADTKDAFPVRAYSESAHDFVARTFEQFQLLKERVGVDEFKTQANLDREFRARLQTIGDEQERQEVLLQLARRADQGSELSILHYLYSAWAQGPDFLASRKNLIAFTANSLWNSFERALPELAQEEKKARGVVSGVPHSLFAVRQRVDSIRRSLVEVEGGRAELRCIQTALRMRFRTLAEFWESGLRRQLNGFPVVKPGYGGMYNTWTRQDWETCKLGEDFDDLLLHLAQRMPQWSYRRRDQYEDGALPFYRRFTPESRMRCWQWVEQATNLDFRLVEMINGFDDEEMWLRVLAVTPVAHPSFFEMWSRRRGDTLSREKIVVSVLEALTNSTREGGVAMMLQMLGDVELSELAPHWVSIAQSLESPHPKVAKWALETLRKMPDAELDWPHVVDVVGEKLWSDSATLAKEAARFLGGVPAAHAAGAWEKLEEALALDNMVLVDACLRALAELKKKNRSATLAAGATERLESLAQLAPERFAKPLARFQAP